jgi:hypothetical protein
MKTTGEITTVWQYAYQRLERLRRLRRVRLEVALDVLLMLLLFGPSLLTWWRRWTLPASPQGYAVLVLPLTLAWLWLNRFRLAIPELDMLRKRFMEAQGKRGTVAESARSAQDASIVRMLMEERLPRPKRLLWPLALACLLTSFAYWVNDPTLTCTAFIAMLTGLIVYRHGTQALRVAAFPLCFLLLMIPLPGVVLDNQGDALRNFCFKFVFHILTNAGLQAEIPLENNPIKVVWEENHSTLIYAGKTGLGVAEAGMFLLVTIWFLSLVRTPFRFKIGALACGVALVSLLLIGRLTLLCWIGAQDSETGVILAWITRYLVPVLAIPGQLYIMRLLQCRKYQRWVSV